MKITNSGRGIHPREISGLEKLKDLPDHWHAFTNLDLALPGKGVREIDLVMVVEDRLLLVDLKDWKGPISSKDGNWLNGKRDHGRSPVHKLAENVRELFPLLRKFLADQERKEQITQKLATPWIEGVVVLTRVSDRSGISPLEVSRVFSVDPFMKMLRNRTERDAQLCVSPSRHTDFTATEWIARFRRFFNTSGGIFQPGTRRYGGFRATHDSPSFVHRAGLFSEFDVEEEGVAMSSGFLRRWDFTKAETRFQNEEGRATIVGREKTVIAWLNDRSPRCEVTLIKPKVDDQEGGVAYWEVFERRRRMQRLGEFVTPSNLNKTTVGERVELARQILLSAKSIHDLQASHLDIGLHSVWLETPSTARLSHLMAASLPAVETLGNARFQFLSSSKVPEDVLGIPVVGIRKDVFLLSCAVHTLVFGMPPAGDPPEWSSGIDPDGMHAVLHPWFERGLDVDPHRRFASASEMLEAFNLALASVPGGKATIEGLDRFRSLKSQRQVFQAYPESALIQEDDRVAIWRSDLAGSPRIVKLWKGTALGDLTKEAPRILAFLERAQALIESPIPGTATLRGAHWTGDSIVLVQDCVDGSPLSEVMKQREPSSRPEHVLKFLRTLIDIVAALHARSVAHGDLKPANILVTPSSDGGGSVPVLIDVLDFAPSDDGERMSGAYAPASGGRFERDRFAVTKITEEIAGADVLSAEAWRDIAKSIEQCRTGPPANGTLIPLQESLDRAARPPDLSQGDLLVEISLVGARAGLMLADEGIYGVSRFGSRLHIRGATEQLDVILDPADQPVSGRRIALRQSAVQRAKRQEIATFRGQVIVSAAANGLTEVSKILEQPEIAKAMASGGKPLEQDIRDDGDASGSPTEVSDDELDERISESPVVSSSVDVYQLWRRMVDLEAELTTEAAALSDSTFQRAANRHVVPIQMMAGELDFDRNDTVIVERQDAHARWSKLGILDVSASTPEFIGVESWADADRGPLVADGTRIRFQSRYENTSRERREEATSRILRGGAAAPSLFEVFQTGDGVHPRRVSSPVDDAEIAGRYGLNQVQIDSFQKLLECRPVGLLQGPPGTGKTRFIGALVHYALTRGLARNVLLASQSHESVNNAGEAVLEFFGNERDSLSLIRVGQEGSVSEALRPYHVSRVEKAYKDRILATATSRLNIAARSLGLPEEVSDRVIRFEDTVQPILTRMTDLSQDSAPDLAKLNALRITVEQQLSAQHIALDLSGVEPERIEECVTAKFLSALPGNQAAKIEDFRHVIQLNRDIAGSVSTWQRSFETFLAGTRQVVAGTCVGLGRTSLGLTKTVFDLVVVDEAARCTPSELSVPIQSGKWIVLVGDHAQLEPLHRPEVVASLANELSSPLHEIVRSDFERTFESAYGREAGATLTKQYRMLPPIGRVVSTAFYDRALQHGRTEPIVPVNALPPDLSRPLLWAHTDSLGASAYQRLDKVNRGSLVNLAEADAIIGLLKRWSGHEPFLRWLTTQTFQAHVIGVICAYAGQRDIVWRKLQAEHLPDVVRRSIKVDTIDSYQGKQNPIVVVSLVRNNAEGPYYGGGATIRPGFLARKNRINVAVSRAMDRLVVVGAKSGWRPGSPVHRVIEGFIEEVKCDEAMIVDVTQLLESPSPADRRKKPSSPAQSNPPGGVGK